MLTIVTMFFMLDFGEAGGFFADCAPGKVPTSLPRETCRPHLDSTIAVG